jgi:hypothetical protein
MNYEQKYLKYKSKYISLKEELNGGLFFNKRSNIITKDLQVLLNKEKNLMKIVSFIKDEIRVQKNKNNYIDKFKNTYLLLNNLGLGYNLNEYITFEVVSNELGIITKSLQDNENELKNLRNKIAIKEQNDKIMIQRLSPQNRELLLNPQLHPLVQINEAEIKRKELLKIEKENAELLKNNKYLETNRFIQMDLVEQKKHIYNINLSDLGHDFINDPNNSQPIKIKDFIEESDNKKNSFIWRFYDQKDKYRTFMINKNILKKLLLESIVYPCLKANNYANKETNVNERIKLYSLAKIFGVRILVSKEILDSILQLNTNNYVISNKNLISFPSIASQQYFNNVANNDRGASVGALHCNTGDLPENLWNLISIFNIKGGLWNNSRKSIIKLAIDYVKQLITYQIEIENSNKTLDKLKTLIQDIIISQNYIRGGQFSFFKNNNSNINSTINFNDSEKIKKLKNLLKKLEDDLINNNKVSPPSPSPSQKINVENYSIKINKIVQDANNIVQQILDNRHKASNKHDNKNAFLYNHSYTNANYYLEEIKKIQKEKPNNLESTYLEILKKMKLIETEYSNCCKKK